MGGMIQKTTDRDRVRYRASRDEVLRYLGYSGQEVDASFERRLDDLIERCERISNPGWTYHVYPVHSEPDGLHLVGTTLVLCGADIRAHLEGARECAVMVATLGLANERELRRVSLLNGLDGIGTSAARSIMEAYAERPFETIEDIQVRGKANKTAVEALRKIGLLDGMDESNQLSFF